MIDCDGMDSLTDAKTNSSIDKRLVGDGHNSVATMADD